MNRPPYAAPMVERPDKAQQASREATAWLILLQDEPGDAELRRRFDAWAAADPVNAAAWSATARTAGIIATLPPRHAAAWQPYVAGARARAAARTTRRRLGLGLAAAALAACLAVLIGPSLILRLQSDHATGTAELREVTLADGSVMVLAPDSAAAIAYTGAERRIVLLAGQAFFIVRPDAARPFRVAAGGIDTTDLGTAFDVRRTDEGARISVQEGRVRVDYGAVSETLAAGQALRLPWRGQGQRAEVPVNQIAAWRQRQLIAQDQPTAEMVDQIRPYFRGRILLMDDGLAAQPVTGVYNLADPAEALRAVVRAHGATVRRITPWLLVVTAG